MQRVYARFIFSTSHTLFFPHNFPQYCSYSSSSSSSTHDFAEYLVNSLGFSHQKAITASTKLSKCKVNFFNLSTNAVSVVNFFKDHDFDDAHIRKIVSLHPKVLTYGVDKTIKPKLGFLIDQGFSGIDLISLVTKGPRIFAFNVDSSISPAILVLREILVCNAHVIDAFKNLVCRCFSSSTIINLSPNVAFLRSYGVPNELIRKHLIRQPITYLRNPESFKDIVIRVSEKHGIAPSSTMFLYGVRLFSRFSKENIESKCRLFKSFGWTQSDVDTMMMKNPHCFMKSADNLKKKLAFLMNELELKPSYLISRGVLFTSSLETRIVPRRDVLQILKAKGSLEKSPNLYTVVCMSESRFLKLFVLPFEEVHQLYANHVGCSSLKTLIQEQTRRRPSMK